MKMSRRAKRMERHHNRSRSLAELNMISLMDIFTILVFFLLVNSSDVEILPSVKSVKLPESVAEKSPKRTVVIVVNDRDVLVQGRKVASVTEIFKSDDELIGPLKSELDYQASRDAVAAKAGAAGHAITIMGDKEIPYRLLKKIMVTCVRAKYDNISLAVMKKTPNHSAAAEGRNGSPPSPFGRGNEGEGETARFMGSRDGYNVAGRSL